MCYLYFQMAVKGCKQVTKNLSEMSKELEMLTQSTSVGDLPGKMEEAEAAKTEVEALLLERVNLTSST